MSKHMNYMQEILDFFNMSAKAFAEHSGISHKTIEGWKSKGVDGIGYIALKNIKEVELLRRKCEDFDKLLEIHKKYL